MSGSRAGSPARSRARVRSYVSGLVAGLERKNGWTLAEQAGELSPDWMQRLLRRADWDVDGIRDDVRGYVVGHLGDQAGMQRQYSGTAVRTENYQAGVFLAYASARGHALIDRELYLPQSWAQDRDRCREAGIPDDTEFATKPRLALAMIGRALEAGVPFSWFTAVFTALAVAREAQDRTGLAIRNVIRQLRPLRSATIAVNGAVQAFPPAIDPGRQAILDAITSDSPHGPASAGSTR